MAHQISGTMYVPPELETLICQNMAKAELKCARLVCKSFDRAAVPLLFDEVFVAANYSILDTADLVASRFGLYIRTINLSIIDYNVFSKEMFVANVERRMGRTLERLTFEKFAAHAEHAFDLYNKARTEDLEITCSDELLVKLCLTLSKLPKVRKFTATNYGSDLLCGLGDPLDPNFPWKRDRLCPFKDCKLSVSDHIGFLHPSDPPYSTRREPLNLAMLAISVAKPTITELAILYNRENAIKHENSLFLTARQSARLQSQFQSLKRLRLGLGKSPGENLYDGSTIAKALSFAVNLESLSIDGDFPFSTTRQEFPILTMMSSLLGDCQFPMLKSLKLRSMNARDDEFLDFLENSPGLTHLKLDNFYLESGYWERLLEEICSTFPLESVRLHKIRAWISERKEHEIYYEHPVLLSRPSLRNGNKSIADEAMSHNVKFQARSMNRTDGSTSMVEHKMHIQPHRLPTLGSYFIALSLAGLENLFTRTSSRRNSVSYSFTPKPPVLRRPNPLLPHNPSPHGPSPPHSPPSSIPLKLKLMLVPRAHSPQPFRRNDMTFFF